MRLAVALCLCGRHQEALFIIAVVCSTWSAINLHTSQRDILTPLGDCNFAISEGGKSNGSKAGNPTWSSISFNPQREDVTWSRGSLQHYNFCWDWNCFDSPGRVALLVILLQCLDQHWMVENPGSSCLLLHPWMRWAMRLIQKAYGKVIFFQVSIANRGWRLLFWEWPRREKHILVLFVKFLFNPCWCLLVRFFHLTIGRQCCGNIHYCPIPEKSV